MKFKFKIQDYQTEAVACTVDVFKGQPQQASRRYRRDLGKAKKEEDISLFDELEDETGFRNEDVWLKGEELLKNIQSIQRKHDIKESSKLIVPKDMGSVMLDVEMETGTGKTYVYIKTMFELNKLYGWTKFIVVVPSVAIREGVHKSVSILEEHFMEQYQKKIKYFIYNSNNLNQLDAYSSDGDLNLMIINTQAFNTSFKTNKLGEATNNQSRIIYSERDDFQSRRPIDVIAANRPIIIMDEPQKMEGEATQKALTNFKPLFVLNYSATHRTKHNCIYALDTLDAYQQKLVKKIQVKGITIKNLTGGSAYFYLDEIDIKPNQAPRARLEVEIAGKGSNIRKLRYFEEGDKIYDVAQLEVYKDIFITEINGETNCVTLSNGIVIHKGEVLGDNAQDVIQRLRIRETIKSHFEKESMLFARGIKTLSLFFIDKVSNYKDYSEDGEVVKGEFWKVFEEEYINVLNEHKNLFDTEYQRYLSRFDVAEIHNGYFSIDKKGRSVDSTIKRGSDYSDDESAYDLILKDKERLLSFDEPTRFIFSHSALREGWDNPNVFQICTLRHASSSIAKRQEVGRGLRICVDQNGNRMDKELLGRAVHDINKLTVIANESYEDFTKGLQTETKEVLRERQQKAEQNYFEGREIILDGAKHQLTEKEVRQILVYLDDNDYIDKDNLPTDKFKEAYNENSLAEPSEKLKPIHQEAMKLVASLYDESLLETMVEDGNASAYVDIRLNKNAEKKKFLDLWEAINHKYVYAVDYDSRELVEKSVASIDRNLRVSRMRYQVVSGEQDGDDVTLFNDNNTESKVLEYERKNEVPYDLIGDIANGTRLTRRTVADILQKISPAQFASFNYNPEEFIREVIKLIRDEKATMIVEHITYSKTKETYDLDIFTMGKKREALSKAIKVDKAVTDYIFFDSQGEESFAKELEKASEVCVYTKLPNGFKIPTPVGDYNPDWAIAFDDDKGTKHLFFIAETKGSLDDMSLRPIERSKIECAKKIYNIPNSVVHYGKVKNYASLLDLLQG